MRSPERTYRVLAGDTFTRADVDALGTTEVGSRTWTEWGNVGFEIVSNKVQTKSGPAISQQATVDVAVKDYEVSVVAVDGAYPGPMARFTEYTQDYGLAAIWENSTNLHLYKMVAGNQVHVDQYAGSGYGNGLPTRLRVEGDSVTVLIGNLVVITYTITEAALRTGTKAGINGYTGAVMDDFEVRQYYYAGVGAVATPGTAETNAQVYRNIVRADLPTGYWRMEEYGPEISADINSRFFETTVGTWGPNSGFATVARSTTVAHTGVGSAKATSNGLANQGFYHNDPITMGPYDTITFSCWIYGSDKQMSLLCYLYAGGGFQTSVGNATGTLCPSGTWTYLTFSFTNPNITYDAFRPAVHYTADNAINGEFVYMDDVSVVRGSNHGDGGSSGKRMIWTVGQPTFQVAAKYGNAVTTTGGQIATAPEATDFAYTTGSLEAWVKTSSAGAGYRGIITKQNAYGIFLKDGVSIAYNWNGGADQSSGVNAADGNWHHIIYTFTPGAAAIYVDGVKTSFAAHGIGDQLQKLAIGAGHDTDTGQAIAATIDEVAIYDYRLTDTQAWNHYRSLISDSFNRPDSGTLGYTERGGYAWQQGLDRATGGFDFDIKTNRMFCTSQGLAYIDVGKANHEVQSDTVDVNAYIIARHVDKDNYLTLGYETGTVRLYTILAGVTTAVQSQAGFSQPVTLNMRCLGDTVTWSVNGVLQNTYTISDAALRTGTRVGYLLANSCYADNFRAWV